MSFDGQRVVKEAQAELNRVEKYARKLRKVIEDLGGDSPEPKRTYKIKREKVDWPVVLEGITDYMDGQAKPKSVDQIARATKIIPSRVYRGLQLLIEQGKAHRADVKVGRADQYYLVTAKKEDSQPKASTDRPKSSSKPRSKSKNKTSRKIRKRGETATLVLAAFKVLGSATASEVTAHLNKNNIDISDDNVRIVINRLHKKNRIILSGFQPIKGAKSAKIFRYRPTTTIHAGVASGTTL